MNLSMINFSAALISVGLMLALEWLCFMYQLKRQHKRDPFQFSVIVLPVVFISVLLHTTLYIAFVQRNMSLTFTLFSVFFMYIVPAGLSLYLKIKLVESANHPVVAKTENNPVIAPVYAEPSYA